MLQVPVLDEIGYGKLSGERASYLCRESLTELGLDLERIGEISIALVDTADIQDLNLKYRYKDVPTDVLSFVIDGPYGEMVGEIVISPENVHPEMDVEELVVHGVLHLAGMDHGDDFDASEMAGLQRSVMDSVRGQDK